MSDTSKKMLFHFCPVGSRARPYPTMFCQCCDPFTKGREDMITTENAWKDRTQFAKTSDEARKLFHEVMPYLETNALGHDFLPFMGMDVYSLYQISYKQVNDLRVSGWTNFDVNGEHVVFELKSIQ